jgi:phenylpropionate dioxygenase-like ring-hydroxylating dioxygenase large terminal subunit
MLSVEDNEILTHVGPGTIMGDLLRQYWVPALLSEEVPAPDCPPVRLRLLGENLIGFRVTSGKVALIQDACPHRAASFFFGRNEEEGIRCAYHGWKFDINGSCVDQLNEPEDTKFESKVHATTYPCVERGGLVWAYMGPRADPPPLPDLEPNMMVEGRGRVSPNMFNWNWFQCMENNMDTSHQGILHFGAVPLEDALDPEKAQQAYAGPVEDLKYIVGNRATTFVVKDTDFGCSYGAYRPGEDDTNYFRTMHWLFPWVTMTPVIRLGQMANCVITVPLDDTHTMSWGMSTGRFDAPAGAPQRAGGGRDLLPNTKDFLGRFRLKFFYDTAGSGDYDFGVDREVQKTSRTVTGYTGMPSVIVQDSAITWSQGAIVDRSKEALGSTDAMIIRVRRRLLNAAKELREHGTIPPGVDKPDIYRQRSGWAMVPKDQDFWEYLRPQREAFLKVHTNGKAHTNGHVVAVEPQTEKQSV